MAVDVVYEDDDVDRRRQAAGLVVHPGAGNPTGTLVQGLLARYPEIAAVGDPARPGIVHRLDKGTSGLLVVARTPAAYAALVRMLAAHEVDRRYLALVWGELETLSGMIDAPVGRSAREPTRMTVSARGKEARTRYEVIADLPRPGGGVAARVPARDRTHAPDPGPPRRPSTIPSSATRATAGRVRRCRRRGRACTRPGCGSPTRPPAPS